MRKILCFVITICSYFGVYSQNLNGAQHDQIDIPINVVSINSKNYYVERIGSYCCDQAVNLVATGSSGQLLFKTTFTFTGTYWNVPFELTKTNDNCLLLSGKSTNACDVISWKLFILKVDTTGNVVFQTSITNPAFNMDFNLRADVTQHSDSSYYIIPLRSNKLFHYSKTGQLILSTTIPIDSMNSITALTNGNLLINGKISNILVNAELTPSINIVNQQNSANTFSKFIQTQSGVIYGLTGIGTLESISANLLPVNGSTNTVNTSIKLKDFVLRNDSVFTTGINTPSNTPYYAVLNSTFGIQYQAQTTYKNVYPAGISLNNKNKINITTYGTSLTNLSMPFEGVFNFPITGTFFSKQDVGILSFSVLTSSLVFIPVGEYSLLLNSNVTIKNFGTDTVKSFYLNHYGPNLFLFCPGLLHKLYTNVIPPNGTISVSTGTFYAKISQGIPQGVAVKRLVCLNTSVPNYKNDIEISNDDWCDSVSVLRPVGIQENFLSESNVKLYPNPFQNNLTIECDLEMQTIKMYDVLGKLRRDQIIIDKQFTIETSELQSGIYFLKIETEKGMMVKKIIKE